MKAIIKSAGALIALALAASTASAAMPGLQSGAVATNDAAIVKVHGVHGACVLGRFGWHRSSMFNGRVPCRPPILRGHGRHHGPRHFRHLRRHH